MINSLSEIIEGQYVQCIEDLYVSRFKGSNVFTKVFTQGETYPIIILPDLRVLAVASIANGYIQTFFILPEQSDLYVTWDKFNTKFMLLNTAN